MSREDLMKRMSFVKNSIDTAKEQATEAEQKQLEEINKAMEELKEEFDKTSEPVVMDEYVDFEENEKD